jgi:hypothetical protein
MLRVQTAHGEERLLAGMLVHDATPAQLRATVANMPRASATVPPMRRVEIRNSDWRRRCAPVD